MTIRRSLSSLLVSVLCLGAVAAIEPGPTAGLVHRTEACSSAALADVQDWGRLEWSGTLERDGWHVLHLPLPPSDEWQMKWDVQVEVRSPADADVGTFVMRPAALYRHDSGVQQLWFPEKHVDTPTVSSDGTASVRHSTPNYPDGGVTHTNSSSGTFEGYVIVVAATTAHTVHVRLDRFVDARTPHPGPAVAAPCVTTGHGVTMLRSTPDVTNTLHGPAGVVALEGELPHDGWTHIGVPFRSVWPTGVRRLTVDFPSGFHYETVGLTSGAAAQYANGANRIGNHDFVGEMDDVAGTFTATLEHVEASLDVRLVALSMAGAGAALPADLDGSYYLVKPDGRQYAGHNNFPFIDVLEEAGLP